MLIGISFAVAIALQSGAPQSPGWATDLETLRRELSARHGSPWHAIGQAAFDEAVDELAGRLSSLDDAQSALELARIAALIGDGHTEVQLFSGPRAFRSLPVVLYQFDDELRVIGAVDGLEDLLGARVVRFGRLEAAEALLRIQPFLARDMPAEFLHQAPSTLASPEVLYGLGATDAPSEAELEFELESGERLVRVLSPPSQQVRGTSLLQARGVRPPTLSFRPRSHYWFTLELDGLACFQSNVSNDQPGSAALETVAAQFFAEVDRTSPRAIVVDARYNSGGDNRSNAPLVSGLESRPQYRERGRLFVLVGRRTFSAGVGLTCELLRVAEPILVGEPVRGDPQVRVNREDFALPFSGLRVDYSERYEATGFPAPVLAIDLPAAPSFDDFRRGVDPAVQAVLAYLAQEDR
jgi:hypothetical protein